MQLSRDILSHVKTAEVPQGAYFELPEKIVQFGTGVLLRGLPDYYVDKANKQGIFNGRIVVVKSTGENDTSEFDKQDRLYTQCIFGIEDGKQVNEHIINASISRVLHATGSWQKVLDCAANAEIEIVLSNTTEVGITYVEEKINDVVSVSFPGKLLAFLLHRYQVFTGDAAKGMVIVPTELITDNGTKLKDILLKLAHYNELSIDFIDWLRQHNTFCNSLVDRIVPGKPSEQFQKLLTNTLGYNDDLLIISEPYSLWAIETSNAKAKEILSFAKADSNIIIANDITIYRELKLRLLNGSHTFSCGLAHLAGFTTVDEAMNDEAFAAYIQSLMIDEIVPAISSDQLSKESKEKFALSVLDRFRNPYVGHKWLSITLQYSSKMAMRNVPLIKNYIATFNTVPAHMALGFAAHILFMKCSKSDDDKYYGSANGRGYVINDGQASRYALAWQQNEIPAEIVKVILADSSIWNEDLTLLPGFAEATTTCLNRLIDESAKTLLTGTGKQKAVV